MRIGIYFLCLAVLIPGWRAHCGDVLASGNAFDNSNPAFTANLNKLPHTFAFVASAELGTTDLTGFSMVWLDGFSQFGEVPSQALIDFMNDGGTVLVQNPGLGSEPRTQYPFGDEIRFTFTSPDFEETVRILEPDHPLHAGLDDAALSGWGSSALGIFHSQLGSFTALTDNGTDDNWITLVRQVGQGLLIYTQHPIAQHLRDADLAVESGQMVLLNNIIGAEPLAVTPPFFITHKNFWETETGALGCFLPDPNADGLDAAGTASLGYLLTLEKDGAVVYGPEAIAATEWPFVFEIAAENLPAYPYFIGVSRDLNTAVKRRVAADGLLVKAPEPQPSDPGIRRLYRRWLLHLPRQAGGFDGVIEIANPNPAESITVSLIGFAADGEELATETLTIAPGTDASYLLYGPDENGLFADAALVDRVSHLAIWERSRLSKVSLQYVARNTNFGVWVDEVDLETDPVNGRQFRMNGATPTQAFFDGVAILNLTSALPVEILVDRFTENGEAAGEISLGLLNSGAKRLSVLSFDFDGFVANPTYTIRAEGPNGAESIQVLGLSGDNNRSFFASSRVVRKK